MKPKISVIFPVGDRVDVEAEALASVRGQALPDFQLPALTHTLTQYWTIGGP